ncbi:hypothetical protein [Nonomuraea longicatena]|uniref:Uncharacterized protein n=1 Tax=Nonomuraea longicatena TaxID=83682 RepID=A0ABP3ZAU7_9ACTN
MIGRVLDSSALVAWGRRCSPYVEASVWSRVGHTEYVVPIVVTAPALAAALAQLPADTAPVLGALLRMEDVTLVDDLTSHTAPDVAEALRSAAPFTAEHVTAASVVHAARRRCLPVLTFDPAPLLALWPGIEVEVIP